MGANTYRTMSQIVAEEEDPTFARMAEIPKVVFSKTLKPSLTWANTQVVAEDGGLDAMSSGRVASLFW
jgi:hypothetical protein